MNYSSQELEHPIKSHSTYQISVKGFLENTWSERLAGMKIDHYQTKNGPITTLTGNIIDQSELFGVLNTLNDYQYIIINVNKIYN